MNIITHCLAILLALCLRKHEVLPAEHRFVLPTFLGPPSLTPMFSFDKTDHHMVSMSSNMHFAGVGREPVNVATKFRRHNPNAFGFYLTRNSNR
uniref:Secreted protein n=1 Tax=Trichuris muris TaxID=70415 RepID=A0A5S6Q8U9_TRIMR